MRAIAGAIVIMAAVILGASGLIADAMGERHVEAAYLFGFVLGGGGAAVVIIGLITPDPSGPRNENRGRTAT